MALSINTAATTPKGAVVEGCDAAAGTLLNLDIGGGFVDNVEVPADAALAVTAATTNEGYLVYVVLATGVLTVLETGVDQATAALALADAQALDVPAGGVGILAGSRNATTAVGELKDDSVRGKLPAISSDF